MSALVLLLLDPELSRDIFMSSVFQWTVSKTQHDRYSIRYSQAAEFESTKDTQYLAVTGELWVSFITVFVMGDSLI